MIETIFLFGLFAMSTAEDLATQEPQDLDRVLEEILPSFAKDEVKESRVRKSSMIPVQISKRLSYGVAKVQAEPFIGELNETAYWVVLRIVDGAHYLPDSESEEELPREIQKLLETLDPQSQKSQSESPFVQAFYTLSDWWRSPTSEPRSYAQL